MKEFDCDNCAHGNVCAAYHVTINECMDYLPSGDAVQVVRCKDCEHSGVTEFGKRYCKEPLGMYGAVPVQDDSFCSHGKRSG